MNQAVPNLITNDPFFPLEKSLRYHQRRRGFLEGMHRLFMFLVIILGSAAAASFTWVPEATLAFFAALIAAFDLVIGPGQRARDHIILHQRYSALLAEMMRTLQPTLAQEADWRARRFEIEADEPPIYWALEADCHNEMCLARGSASPENLNKLDWWECTFMNFWRFAGVSTSAAGGGQVPAP